MINEFNVAEVIDRHRIGNNDGLSIVLLEKSNFSSINARAAP